MKNNDKSNRFNKQLYLNIMKSDTQIPEQSKVVK